MQCDQCKFWLEVGQDTHLAATYGQCHRHPPQRDTSIESKDVHPLRHWHHPLTLAKDWCGEHQPRPVY